MNVLKEIVIRPLLKSDIAMMAEAFKLIGWEKPGSLFESYLSESEKNERKVWVAFLDKRFVGYVTLKWDSLYLGFKVGDIPEVMDLNVLPEARKMGIGSLLLESAEKEASTKSDMVGIGVGLYAGEDGGYGPAQRLYVKRGYIPDGKGLTYGYKQTIPYERYVLDDDLVLWFTKKLR